MNKVILSIIILFMVGCTQSKYPYIAVIDRTTARKSAQICREENLKIAGAGGAMMDSITKVSITFASIGRKMDLAEARGLLVKCIEEIKNEINSTEELQPFLDPYPFPVSGMDIGIMILDMEGHFVEYGCAYLGKGGVSALFQCKGKIYYESYNPRTERLETFYEEPYEVALAIVRGEIPMPEIECSAALE